MFNSSQQHCLDLRMDVYPWNTSVACWCVLETKRSFYTTIFSVVSM